MRYARLCMLLLMMRIEVFRWKCAGIVTLTKKINRSLSPYQNTIDFVLVSFHFAAHSIAFSFAIYKLNKVKLNDFYRWQWFHAYLFTFVRIEIKSQFYWKQIDDLFCAPTKFHIRLQTFLWFPLFDVQSSAHLATNFRNEKLNQMIFVCTANGMRLKTKSSKFWRAKKCTHGASRW